MFSFFSKLLTFHKSFPKITTFSLKLLYFTFSLLFISSTFPPNISSDSSLPAFLGGEQVEGSGNKTIFCLHPRSWISVFLKTSLGSFQGWCHGKRGKRVAGICKRRLIYHWHDMETAGQADIINGGTLIDEQVWDEELPQRIAVISHHQ